MLIENSSFFAAFEAKFQEELAALQISELVFSDETFLVVENLALRVLQQLADEEDEVISNKQAIAFVAAVMSPIEFKIKEESSLPNEA